MQAKLTLRLDDQLIAFAKKEAKKSGKSLSQMIADYFKLLKLKGKSKKQQKEEFGPITSALMGAFKTTDVDEKDYYRYLEEKYK